MRTRNFFMNKDIEYRPAGNKIKRKVLAHNNNLMCVEVYFEKGAVGEIHSHHHEQITYVISGEFEFTVNNVKRIIKPGDSLYNQPNILHGVFCIKEGILLDIFSPSRNDFI